MLASASSAFVPKIGEKSPVTTQGSQESSENSCWQKVKKVVCDIFEGIGNFFQSIVSFFKSLFSSEKVEEVKQTTPTESKKAEETKKVDKVTMPEIDEDDPEVEALEEFFINGIIASFKTSDKAAAASRWAEEFGNDTAELAKKFITLGLKTKEDFFEKGLVPYVVLSDEKKYVKSDLDVEITIAAFKNYLTEHGLTPKVVKEEDLEDPAAQILGLACWLQYELVPRLSETHQYLFFTNYAPIKKSPYDSTTYGDMWNYHRAAKTLHNLGIKTQMVIYDNFILPSKMVQVGSMAYKTIDMGDPQIQGDKDKLGDLFFEKIGSYLSGGSS